MITARNLVIGKMYIDLCGKTQVINHTKSEVCEIFWRERGWGSSKNANVINGITKDASGKQFYKVHGVFTKYVHILDMNDPNAQDEEVWRIRRKTAATD